MAAAQDRPYFRYFDFKPSPKTYGVKADAFLGFRVFAGVDTALWGRLEGAYKFADYYRTDDLSLYRQDLFPGIDSDSTALPKAIALWGLGIQQGLHFSPARDRDDVTLLASWRGAWTDPTAAEEDSLLESGDDPYRGRSLIQSFQLDLYFDKIDTDKATKVMSGWSLDASAEYAPPGLSRPSSANYAQFDLAARGFLPLIKMTDDRGWNLLGLYLGGFAGVDYIAGLGDDATDGVPYVVSQRFGGRVYREGLGGSVRGLGDGWADGAFKAVGNLELRCTLPALLRKDLVIGTVAFADAGYYADPPGAPSSSELRSGSCASVGLGGFIDIFDKGYISVYTAMVINTANYLNEYWQPFGFEFGLHF
jgi:hypothetical protein